MSPEMTKHLKVQTDDTSGGGNKNPSGGRFELAEVSYRVETEAVSVGDVEGVVLVCENNDVRHRIDTQGIIVSPEYRTDVQRQWSQVTLGQDSLHKLRTGREYR